MYTICRLSSVLLLALAGSASVSGAPAADVERIVSDGEKAWAKAVVARDAAALDRLYGDRLLYVHSSGVRESKAVFVGRLKSGAQIYQVLEHEKLEVVPYGDMAVVHGILKVSGVAEGKNFGGRLMVLHVWHKENGHWRMVAHQSLKLL
ncbi:MAG: nuclear transport factor 2 family protein [Acidobacteria bacterium]|nr:nuclear transport factor 2 family protein [Acidobacteriota bacterium]